MTCKACGRDVALEDKNCFDCNDEGPFTRADRLTPWVRRFAWFPVAVEDNEKAKRRQRYPSFRWIWLRRVEERSFSIFGREERQVRLSTFGD